MFILHKHKPISVNRTAAKRETHNTDITMVSVEFMGSVNGWCHFQMVSFVRITGG